MALALFVVLSRLLRTDGRAGNRLGLFLVLYGSARLLLGALRLDPAFVFGLQVERTAGRGWGRVRGLVRAGAAARNQTPARCAASRGGPTGPARGRLGRGMSLHATLYMKPDCHLCETARGDLARLQRRHPHTLALVDITTDGELMRQYGQRIPVCRSLAPSTTRRSAGGAGGRVAARRGGTAPSTERSSVLRHWLAALNLAVGLFLTGALAAPVLAALGWRSAADGLYAAYHLTCHQWAFRSFFLFGPQTRLWPEQLPSSVPTRSVSSGVGIGLEDGLL